FPQAWSSQRPPISFCCGGYRDAATGGCMSAGYGRGYYGENQLAKSPRRGGGWFKVALVVGVGAVVWLMWPRSAQGVGRDAADAPRSPALPPSVPSEGQVGLPSASTLSAPAASLPPAPSSLALPAAAPGIDQAAQSRGYASSKEYEDAVVASARQLQD